MERTAKGILWDIFNIGSTENPKHQLQRVDDPDVDLELEGDEIPGQPLDSDMLAMGWAVEEAMCGIKEAKDALRLVGVYIYD